MFAWSFDRLMPEKLADVNARTHSPVRAIILVNVIIAGLTIWSVYSNVFQLVLGLIVLAGCLAVVIVGVAAIALPFRRPDLYRSSPANVKFLGIPVLFIVARLAHMGFYLSDRQPLRSASFFVGLIIVIAIFVQTAFH